jgi:hypothetical protein
VRRRFACALVVAALATGSPARAAGGALESIASQGAKLGTAPALVVSAPLVADVAAPRGEELASRVAQLVAGAMGGATRAQAGTATLPQARALAGRAAKDGMRLVFLQPEIAKGFLRVTLDGYPSVSNGWDRVRNAEPPPSAHAFAEAPIDAEVRVFLASIPLEHASVHRAWHDEGDVLAAACGDLDGDGGMEVVLVSRARVAAGHVNAGRFVPSRTAPWSALAPRAAVPMREPIGGASIVEADGVRLLVGTTDRGGVALDASLVLVGALRGIPVPASDDACAAPLPEASAFGGDVTACTAAATPAVRSTGLPPRFDAVALADVIRPDGTARAAQIAREPGGKLQLRFGEASLSLDDVGAQVTLADLDQDGTPEIVASAAGAAGGDDAINVTSWDGASDPRPRLRLPAPGGVRALCVCPPEEGSAPALVAVVGGEVWIVR